VGKVVDHGRHRQRDKRFTWRRLWNARFDELDKVIEELKRKEKADGRKKRE
jgi:hypothetical protein